MLDSIIFMVLIGFLNGKLTDTPSLLTPRWHYLGFALLFLKIQSEDLLVAYLLGTLKYHILLT